MKKTSVQYLIYTFSIMAVCWGSCIIFSLFHMGLDVCRALYVLYLLGGLSPTIASFIVLKKSGEVKSFKEWLKNVFGFGCNIRSYLLVLAFSILFFLPQSLISGYEQGAPIYALVFMLPVMLFCGGLEEAGWRYVLQPKLEHKFSFVIATLIVSVIWWLWHLPLFFIPGVAQYGANYFLFGINVLALSFALAAIRKVTKSVWLCVLFHCLINSLSGIFLVKENPIGNAVSAAVVIAASCLFVWLDKKRNSTALV